MITPRPIWRLFIYIIDSYSLMDLQYAQTEEYHKILTKLPNMQSNCNAPLHPTLEVQEKCLRKTVSLEEHRPLSKDTFKAN